MQGTSFEFKNRAFIIGAVFFAGFACNAIDRVIVVNVLANAMTRAGISDVAAEHLVLGVAAAIIFLAFLVRAWATSYLKPGTVYAGVTHSERLVTDGPYRFVRNPLYFGNILFGLGMTVIASRLGAVVFVLGMILVVYRLAAYEEAQFAPNLGEQYAAFLARVPMLFPALTPRIAPSGFTPDWMKGLLAESAFFGIACGMTVFAVTLKPRLLFISCALLVPFFLMMAVLASRKRGNVHEKAQ